MVVSPKEGGVTGKGQSEGYGKVLIINQDEIKQDILLNT